MSRLSFSSFKYRLFLRSLLSSCFSFFSFNSNNNASNSLDTEQFPPKLKLVEMNDRHGITPWFLSTIKRIKQALLSTWIIIQIKKHQKEIFFGAAVTLATLGFTGVIAACMFTFGGGFAITAFLGLAVLPTAVKGIAFFMGVTLAMAASFGLGAWLSSKTVCREADDTKKNTLTNKERFLKKISTIPKITENNSGGRPRSSSCPSVFQLPTLTVAPLFIFEEKPIHRTITAGTPTENIFTETPIIPEQLPGI